MFLIKAGTVIQIEALKSQKFWHTTGWVPYTTKEDKLYDKEEVWDAVSCYNDQALLPMWAHRNIMEHGYVVIKRAGKYAMVRPANIQYLD
jgi:hypothetical protein